MSEGHFDFHQANPGDQMACVLMALEGHISNLEEGIVDVPKAVARLKLVYRQLVALRCFMRDEWVRSE